MIILTLRTDKVEAEIGLYDDDRQLDYDIWEAHRQLSMTVHRRIESLLQRQQKTLTDIEGLIAFQGPGSFTGLRIGLSVANALAYGLAIPIIAAQNPNWIETGVTRLLAGESDHQALPFYGAEVYITPQKK